MSRSYNVELTGDEVDTILAALEDTWTSRLRTVSQGRRGELRLKYVALFGKLGRLLDDDESSGKKIPSAIERDEVINITARLMDYIANDGVPEDAEDLYQEAHELLGRLQGDNTAVSAHELADVVWLCPKCQVERQERMVPYTPVVCPHCDRMFNWDEVKVIVILRSLTLT